MALKHNCPCHAAAADDEPIFTLRAKDATAPWTVALWMALRCRDFEAARRIIEDARCALSIEERSYDRWGSAKLQEANECRCDMVAWFNGTQG